MKIDPCQIICPIQACVRIHVRGIVPTQYTCCLTSRLMKGTESSTGRPRTGM